MRAAGAASPEAEAWAMLEAVSGLTRLDLMLARDADWATSAASTLHAWVEARGRGVPLQHLLGVAPFYGIDLACDGRALVPRPETERLVELVLEDLAGVDRPVVVDVGTGSGAIAIALGRARPDAEVWACDVAPAALDLARANVAAHAPQVEVVASDLLTAPELAPVVARVDRIVANLPYLPDSDARLVSREVRHDPATALYGGSDGLGPFRALVDDLARRMPRSASAWFEVDPRNVDDAAAWCRAKEGLGERRCRTHADLVGRVRFVQWGPDDGAGARIDDAARRTAPQNTAASATLKTGKS